MPELKIACAELALLERIGNHVPGPRHTTEVEANTQNLDLLDSLIEKKLVESTGCVQHMRGLMVRVCLTSRGWVKYQALAN